MKNLLKYSLACFCFLIVNSAIAQNSVSYSTSLPSRTINNFYGINGVNNMTDASSFANPEVRKQLEYSRPAHLRFPGGTLANYWDWQEGWYKRNWSDKGCFSLEKEDQRRRRLTSVFDANGTPITVGGDYLEDLRGAILNTGAKPLFVLNAMTSDLDYQLAMLLQARELNLPIENVEIGNEYFLDRCAYQEAFQDASKYAELIKGWKDAMHTVVGSDVRVSAVAAKEDPQGGATERRKTWNSIVSNSVDPDAFSIHHYKSTGLSNPSVLIADYNTLFSQVNNGMGELTNYMDQLSGNKPVWITEYGLLERYNDIPIHGTWFHGLFNAYTTLKLLEKSRIESCDIHAMAGNFIFSNFFSTDNGFSGGGDFTLANGCTPNASSTVAYGKTAVGMMMNQIGAAINASDIASPLDFVCPTSPTLLNNNPVLYGWDFANSITDERNLIILNLSDQEFQGFDVGSSGTNPLNYNTNDIIQQLTFDNPQYYFYESKVNSNTYNFIEDVCNLNSNQGAYQPSSGTLASLYNSTSINLPKFSITRITRPSNFFPLRVLNDTIISGTKTMITCPYDTSVIYSWSTGDSTNTIEVAPLSTQDYTLTVYNKTTMAQISQSSKSVFVIPAINLTLNASQLTACSGSQITLQADISNVNGINPNGFHFVYITTPNSNQLEADNKGLGHHYQPFSGSASDQLVVSPTQTTTYTVYITDDLGKIATHASVTITVPSIKLANDYRFCKTESNIVLDDAQIFNNGNGYTCYWTYGNNNYTSNDIVNTGISINSTLANQPLTVDVNFGNGCYGNASTNIIIAECCPVHTTSTTPPIVTLKNAKDFNSIKDAVTLVHSSGVSDVNRILTIKCTDTFNVNNFNIKFDGKSYIKNLDRSTIDPFPNNYDFYDELEFDGCTIYFSEAAALEVEPSFKLTFSNCDIINACESTMWQGLVCDDCDLDFTTTTSTNRRIITHAEYAVDLKRGAKFTCKRMDFNDNLVSLKADDVKADGFNLIQLQFTNNKIQGIGTNLPTAYIGQSIAYSRQPLAGTIFNGIVAAIGNTTSSNNFFTNLNQGIVATNSIVGVVNTKFSNIQIEQNYKPFSLAGGTAVYSIGDASHYSMLNFAGDRYNSIPDFNNCLNGIVGSNTSLYVYETRMMNMEYGVRSENNLSRPVSITENDLTARSFGIQSMLNEAASFVNIANNDITMEYATNVNSTGIFINETGIANSSRNLTLLCNHVNMSFLNIPTDQYGIRLLGVNYAVVTGNSVLQNYLTAKQIGISVESGGFNTFSFNTISGNSFSSSVNKNGGMSITYSSNNSLRLNTIQNTENGFIFNGLCNNTNFEKNVMNTYKTGLFLPNDVTGGAIMGQQNEKQNKWIPNNSIAIDAKNDASNQFKLAQSLFINNPNLGLQYNPAQVIPSQNWFFPFGTMGLSNTNDNGNCISAQRQLNMSYTASDSLLLNSPNSSTIFADESWYMENQGLYNKIEDVALANSSVLFEGYKDQLEQSSIGKIDEVHSEIQFTKKIDNQSLIIESDSLLVAEMNLLQSLHLDSIDLLWNGIERLYHQKANIDTVFSIGQTNWTTSISTIGTINNQIWDSINLVNKEKFISQVLLKELVLTRLNLTTSEIQYLYYLANLCPMDGGNAVYRARAIIAMFNDSIVFYDDVSCLMAYNLRAGRKDVSNSTSVRLIGNPLSIESRLEFNEETGENYILELYNNLNQLVFSTPIPSSINTWKFPEKLLAKQGYFTYRITDKEELITSGKLVIIN